MNAKKQLQIVLQLTNVAAHRIEVNEIGWTSRVYVIDGGDIVFKFPRSKKIRKACRQEVAVLGLLKEQKFGLKLPVLNWTAKDNRYFGFFGVKGKPLKDVIAALSEEKKINIGAQIGAFLKQLHAIKNYGQLKVQTLEQQANLFRRMYRKGRPALRKLFTKSELQAIDAFFAHELRQNMTGTKQPVFCHGDLDYNNVFVDDRNQVGIIDFGDAGLYDRSQDFRGIEDETIRTAMIRAYGDEKVISKAAAEATAKAIDVLNLIHDIKTKNVEGVEKGVQKVKKKLLHQIPLLFA